MVKVDFEYNETENYFLFKITSICVTINLIYRNPRSAELGQWKHICDGRDDYLEFGTQTCIDSFIFSNGKKVDFDIHSSEIDVNVSVPFEDCQDALKMSLETRNKIDQELYLQRLETFAQ